MVTLRVHENVWIILIYLGSECQVDMEQKLIKRLQIVNRGLLTAGAVSLLLLAFTLPSYSAPTNKKDARKAVSGWLKLSDRPLKAKMSKEVLDVNAYRNDAGEVVYYVVAMNPEGYVVVSPDDLIEPIVAFSPSGTYDHNPENPFYTLLQKDMPKRLKHVKDLQDKAKKANRAFIPTGQLKKSSSKWNQLQEKDETQASMYMADGPASAPPESSVDDIRVDILVQSRWGQSDEGGSDCYDYYTPSNYKAGCVATAFAQLLRYHQYPTAGIGAGSYPISINGSSTNWNTRGGDGSGGAYDWANMVLDPDATIKVAERKAIGSLTADCGVTVKMNFTSGESGAYLRETVVALTNVFGYANAVGWNVYMTQLAGNGLNEMVNPNLDAGFPVLFGIVNSGTGYGHAIVCDGYGYNASTLYHHLNLGWLGASDSWYNLPDMSTVNYDTIDGCIYNVFPNSSGEIISGRVLNGSGTPQSGLTITADDGSNQYTDVTDTNGIYGIIVPPATEFTLSCPAASPKTVTTGTSIKNDVTGNVWTQNFTTVSGATLFYTPAAVFSESLSNDGTIADSITIALSGDTFTGANAADVSANVVVTNLPQGLSAQFIKDNDTQLTVTLNGSATSHSNYIDNLSFTFLDSAFSGGLASAISNYNKSDIVIEFFDYFINENFDASTSLPSGWSETNITGFASWRVKTGGWNLNKLPKESYPDRPSNAKSGPYNSTCYSFSAAVTRLLTPITDFSGYTNLNLNFWHAQAESIYGAQDILNVFYSTNGGSSWMWLAGYSNSVPSWTQRTISLPSGGSSCLVAFEASVDYASGVCIDDVKIMGSSLTYPKLTPTVSNWPSATPITYGQALSNATLSGGSASVPGAFGYTAPETVPDAGTYPAPVEFTPNDSTNYAVVEGSVNVTVNKATPTVTNWPAASSIESGQTVSDSVLTGGGATVPGSFSFDSPEVVPPVGTYTAAVTFVASDSNNYSTVGGNAEITVQAGTLDILVIGSSNSFSVRETTNAVQQKAFDPTALTAELQSILANDTNIAGSVNIVFEDIYRSKAVETSIGGSGDMWPFTYYCHSLMQYFMWPDGKTNRLANLRGEGGTAWDYVVIMGDPYLMANKPGVFAEGVSLLAEEISSGTAEPILLAQWPENSSSFSASDFNEVVYRVGESAGLRVVPAGKAWGNLTPQDTSASHPTPDGAYLAAACIYSELYGRSAKDSSYTYDNTIADHALSEVQANHGVTQYTGIYTNVNPFQMKYLKKRVVEFCEYGTSTEEGFYNGLLYSFGACGVGYNRRNGTVGDPVDFSYSRGTRAFEPTLQFDYDNRLNKDEWTYAFPMGDHSTTGSETMRYGIDKRYYADQYWYNGTDLGVAYTLMMSNYPPVDVRATPVRLIWSKMKHYRPELNSHRDSWHLSNEIDRGVGAFMYTLVSGRCPIGDEPSDDTSTDWKYWFCAKLGYETAWQMSHLTTRAPGFQVLPISATASNVSPTVSETLAVRFAFAPTSDVTVAVSVDDDFAGIVSPGQLTFTPLNYSNAQPVTVEGETGLAGSYVFNVTLNTSSTDPVYDGLSDSWDFMNTRPDGPTPSDIRVLINGSTVIAGDMTPDVGVGTDFGIVESATPRTFVITNRSTTTAISLTNTPDKVTIADATTYFSLSQDAGVGSLAAGESTTFEITYNPLSYGIHAATVTVASTDTSVPVYSFAIRGSLQGSPTVSNTGASSSGSTSAQLTGLLTDGVAAQAWFCWGTADAGTNSTGDWEHTIAIGSVDQDVGFSSPLSGLLYGTVYDYRVFVTNTHGQQWSGLDSFNTAVNAGAPPAVENTSAANIQLTSAVLGGVLDCELAYLTVSLYYSTNNNMTSTAWQNDTSAESILVGTYTNVADFAITQPVTSLTASATYYYTFMATNEVITLWPASNASFTPSAAYVLPFTEDFESRDLGNLNGQNGWVTSDAVVQTNLAIDTQGGSITSATGFVRHDFTSGTTNVWIDFQIRPQFSPEIPVAPTEETAYVVFDTNGVPVAFDGTNAVAVSGVTVTTGEWVRVTIHCDYSTQLWDLYINGSAATQGLAFCNASITNFMGLEITGDSQGVGTEIDNIVISVSSTLETSKTTPTVTNWPTAAPITYGQAYSNATLSGGGASVSGTFGYDAPATVPNAGTNAAPVTFLPYDTTNYNSVAGAVTVTVAKAVAEVTISDLVQTYDGSAKTVAVVTAPTNLIVDVTYEGIPAAPTNAGSYAVTGTVAEVNYQGTTNVTLVINKAEPTVTNWPTATDINVGQAVSNSVLSGGSASVAGAFSFDDPASTPPLGVYTAAVTFLPNDSTNYLSVAGEVTMDVWASNTQPIAVDDSDSVDEDASVIVDVLDNDTDGDGDSLVVSSVTQGANGGVVNNATNVTYTPDTDYNGDDSFTYVASDGRGGFSTGTVSITVNPINDLPVPTLLSPTNGNTFVYGDSILFSVAGSDVDGTVDQVKFYADAGLLATSNSCPASLWYTNAAAGDHQLYAVLTDNSGGVSTSSVATVTVTKATATVALSDLTQVYDGNAKSVTAETVPTGLTVNVTYDGNAAAPTNVGSYAVTGTVAEANYQGETNGTLTINVATPVVTTWPTASDIIVGQAVSNAILSGGVSTPSSGTYSFNSPAATPPLGVYTAAVTFLPDNSNYTSLTGEVSVTVLPLPPGVPTNVSAIASMGQVDLSWDAVSGANSYKVKRSATSGNGYAVIASPSGNSYADTNANNGTVYYYVISAVGDGGEGDDSVEVSAATPYVLPFTEDFEFRDLGNLHGQNGWVASDAVVQTNLAIDIQGGSITSETGFVRHDFAGSATNAWIDFQIRPQFSPEIPSAPTSETAYVVFDTNGVPVAFDGTNAVAISGITVTTGEWVRVTIHCDYSTQLWDLYINGAAATQGLAFCNASATNFTRLEIEGGSQELGAAIDDVVISVSATLGGVYIPAPSALVASAVSGWQVDLAWSDQSTNETGFVVERSQTNNANFGQIAALSADSTNHTDTGRTPGQTYYYRVFATNSIAESASSSEASVTTPLEYMPFTVTSPYGSPSPDGVTSNLWNTTVEAYIPDSPVVSGNGLTQYVCKGWVATGSATSGTGTNTSFTITNDTTITWQWSTNYYIDFQTIGE